MSDSIFNVSETCVVTEASADIFLPLSSLRLLVPPLRLVSAAMWQAVQRKDIMDYGKLEEFVMLVTDTVPELLTCKQKAQLLLSLRERLIVELCQYDHSANPESIQPILDRMRPAGHKGSGDAEVDAEETIFLELIQTLLKDPAQRTQFFEEVFPVEYGVRHEKELDLLLWDFLCSLEKLLPVPDLGQTASWLSAAPSVLDECLQFISNPEDLKSLLRQHRSLENLGAQGGTVEMFSQVFACSHCPFFHMQESYLQLHLEKNHPEEYNQLNREKELAAARRKNFPRVEFPMPFPIHSESEMTPTRASHSCPQCGKCFTRSSDVTRHQRIHTGERLYTCKECNKSFKNSWDLTRHERVHTGERPYCCPQCGKRFTQFGLLTLHFERTGCKGSEDQLHRGEITEHKERGAYKCQKCGECFNSILERLQHRQNHTVKHHYKCSQCEKSYSRRHDLKRHQMTHTGEKPFSCAVCGKCFTHWWILQKHQYVHNSENPVSCAVCGKHFNQLMNLNRHMLIHSSQRPFPCSVCEKSFTQLASLTRHKRTHTGERPFGCETCSKAFFTHGELVRHSKSHTDERPYPCSLCEKSFRTKRALREHMYTHTGEQPYSCKLCGKTFSKSTSLVRHNLIHTGERPHVCGHCRKTFLTSGELLLHTRIHTGERPYPCTHCERRFRCSSDLRMHLRAHTGERPFNCKECKKSYSTTTNLKRHMLTHRRKSAQLTNVVLTHSSVL